jgi:hypothetical protein
MNPPQQTPRNQGLLDFESLLPLATEWATFLAASSIREGIPLDDQQQKIAVRAGVKRPDAVRIFEVDEFPLPSDPVLAKNASALGVLGKNTAGMAIGHAIIVRTECFNQRIIAHELRHVHQYEQAGSIAAFLEQYLRELAIHGYAAAPLEIDALDFEASISPNFISMTETDA